MYQFSGLVILIGYIVFDSFTSNWQGELYSTYKMSSYQVILDNVNRGVSTSIKAHNFARLPRGTVLISCFSR